MNSLDKHIMNKEVTNKVRKIVESYLGPTDNPTEDFSDMGLDSLDKTDLIMSIEKEFNIDIPDEKIDKLNSLNKLQSYVLSRVK